MTEARLLQYCQRHMLATAKAAERALRTRQLAALQQRAEGVSDYPKDIVTRITHHEGQPEVPPVPPLPEDFHLGADDEDARGFAVRALTYTQQAATDAATLTDLLKIQQAALTILALGDAAETRLLIAIREAREARR